MKGGKRMEERNEKKRNEGNIKGRKKNEGEKTGSKLFQRGRRKI